MCGDLNIFQWTLFNQKMVGDYKKLTNLSQIKLTLLLIMKAWKVILINPTGISERQRIRVVKIF